MPDYGRNSAANSSYTPLGAAATFTGEWETNGYAGAYAAISTDQAGTLYIDVGIPTPGGIALVEAHAFPVLAGEPIFRAVVKGSGMASRIRFVNGSVAQSELWLKAGYGNNDVPNRLSEDGEVYTTVTERERNVSVLNTIVTSGTGLNWWGLIDLSDTANWPHSRTGRIDLSTISAQVDKATATRGSIQLCVITRVDGTNADLSVVAGFSFLYNESTGAQPQINLSPSQRKCAVVAGATPYIKTSGRYTGVAAINTGATLTVAGTAETFTPGVGDLVARVQITGGGDATISTALTYHAEAFATSIG